MLWVKPSPHWETYLKKYIQKHYSIIVVTIIVIIVIIINIIVIYGMI